MIPTVVGVAHEAAPTTAPTYGTGGDMQEYEIPDANGGTYTIQLSDEDAKARGLTPATPKAKQGPARANKARSVKNKRA